MTTEDVRKIRNETFRLQWGMILGHDVISHLERSYPIVKYFANDIRVGGLRKIIFKLVWAGSAWHIAMPLQGVSVKVDEFDKSKLRIKGERF